MLLEPNHACQHWGLFKLILIYKGYILTPRIAITGPERAQLNFRLWDSQHLQGSQTNTGFNIDAVKKDRVAFYFYDSRFSFSCTVAVRIHQGRNAHDGKRHAVANQVEQWPGEAIPLNDLHFGESSD